MGISDYLSGGENAERRMRLSDLVSPKASTSYNVGAGARGVLGEAVNTATQIPGAVSDVMNYKPDNPIASAAMTAATAVPRAIFAAPSAIGDFAKGIMGGAPGATPQPTTAPRNPPAGGAQLDTKALLAGGTPGPTAQGVTAPPAAPLTPAAPPASATQLIAPAINPNQLSPKQQSQLDSLVAGQGFQDAPDGTGVVQSTNPDGSKNAPIRIGGNTGIGSDRQRLQSLVQPSAPGSGDPNWDRAASIVGPNRNMGSLVVGGTDFGSMLQAIHNNRQIDRTKNVMAGLGNADKKDADVGLIEQNTVNAKAVEGTRKQKLALLTELADPKITPQRRVQVQQLLASEHGHTIKPEIHVVPQVDALGQHSTPKVIRVNAEGTESYDISPKPTLPPGMKSQVGTKDGKPVYEDANGKRFVGN